MTDGFAWHAGGCHCGGVRFEVALPEVVEAQSCNCSMCAKTGYLHIIVPQSRFRLTKGAERLAEYTFNSRVARHLFCSECGIKSFYRPRSNPDGWSVNARCLDEAVHLEITAFDGANWEANADQLARLSLEPS
ncbi:GFA family protein [Phenylobacterium sp. LH3H17]|uniref:GFA family protein n=1 Tax=Phenylobacterium sp. LH3H17 TaxID=2903901 RepID=UPI0020C9B5B7|nr:GFA family protein [Phenylobacterium sp. LH3H17]UTP37720.1 GFA family protein [Phenylobacterium sp. LH3H17]